jgi:hypothetical protein
VARVGRAGKRGAASPARREQTVRPAFRKLFEAARTAGDIRDPIEADDFLSAAANLCMSVGDAPPQRARQLAALLVNGLRGDPGELSNDEADALSAGAKPLAERAPSRQ